jgi:Fungal specific transcription factor domain
MAMLDKRLKRMEDRVIRLIPKAGDSEAEEPGRHVKRAILKPSAQPGAHATSKRGRKRAANEAFGKDEIGTDGDWRRKQTTTNGGALSSDAREVDEEDGFIQAPVPGQNDTESLMSDGVEHLPPMDIQIHLAETYFDYVYGQSYPLLHKPTFMRNLVAGTVPPVLVLAVCAISARFSTHPYFRTQANPMEKEQFFLRGEEWAAPAREISLRRHDEPNITILTVYLLVALHEFGTCQGGRSWMFGGMAQRMALSLQLHKDKDRSLNSEGEAETSSWTDREIRRRVLWSCFLMDRFISSGSDRPICFPEDCIAVPLPVKENLFNMEIDSDTSMLDSKSGSENLGTAAYIVKLVSIWGRLVSYFNLGGKERENKSLWDSSSTFYSISSALASFKFPANLRWNSDNLAIYRAEKYDNQFIFMHIVYHHLRLFAHRWALPGHGESLSPDVPRKFLEESAATAVNAAEQVSLLIAEALAAGSKVTAPFAGYAAYYSSTVHVLGTFAKDPAVADKAKKTLETNVKFLARMRRYWGMFHFVGVQLRELYHQHEKKVAAVAQDGGAVTRSKGRKSSAIFQYGDWFDKYPSGVVDSTKDSRNSSKSPTVERGVLGGKDKDLLSAEEFFVRLENGEVVRKSRPAVGPTSASPVEKMGATAHRLQINTDPDQGGFMMPNVANMFAGPTSNPSPPMTAGQATQAAYMPIENPIDMGLDDSWNMPVGNNYRSAMPFGSMLAHAAADWFVPWNVGPPMTQGAAMPPQQPGGYQMSQTQNLDGAGGGGFNDVMVGIWSPVAGQGEWDGWLAQ